MFRLLASYLNVEAVPVVGEVDGLCELAILHVLASEQSIFSDTLKYQLREEFQKPECTKT